MKRGRWGASSKSAIRGRLITEADKKLELFGIWPAAGRELEWVIFD